MKINLQMTIKRLEKILEGNKSFIRSHTKQAETDTNKVIRKYLTDQIKEITIDNIALSYAIKILKRR